MISTNVDLDQAEQRDKFIDQLGEHLNYKKWNEVGVGTNPAYQNSWTTTTGKHFGYRYFPITNTVHIHGRLTPGTETDGTVVFTLPENYRPSTIYSYSISTNSIVGGAGGRLEILANGNIAIQDADTSGTYYDINIIYPLDV